MSDRRLLRIDLPSDYDRRDVIDQLQEWREVLDSRRFDCLVDELVTELLMARTTPQAG